MNKVIIGNININSLPAKFDQVKEVILKNVDILVITEAKLDDTFPLGQLLSKLAGPLMKVAIPVAKMF